MTQYDVQLILAIEKHIEEKLEELKLDEEEAMELANKINKAKKIIKIVRILSNKEKIVLS